MKILGFGKKEFPGATARIDFPIAHSVGKGKKLFEEGYKYNVVVFRCTDSIIKAVKGIDVRIKEGDKYIEPDNSNKGAQAVYKILRKPNPKQYKGAFLTEAFINWLILGEMFIVTAEDRDQTPQELWNLDPLEMHVKPGKGLPRAYEQKVNGQTVRWDVDQLSGDSQVFFWKGHNPTDKWRGMSPLHAAALAADTNNAGLRWNFSMLKKGGRLTGLIKYKAGNPDEQAVNRLRKWFKNTIQGEYNAGEIGVLTGEAEYQELGKNPKEMDYIKTVDKTTAFIAMAYGVPLPLVLNEAATFNNYREAKELFYTDTVMPLYQEFLESFGGWLLPKFGLENAVLEFDEDSIPALESLRERRNERVRGLVKDGIISPDEGRTELGYSPRGGFADELYMPASSIPMSDSGATDDPAKLKALLIEQGYEEKDIEAALNGELRTH